MTKDPRARVQWRFTVFRMAEVDPTGVSSNALSKLEDALLELLATLQSRLDEHHEATGTAGQVRLPRYY